ncbi:MAG: mycofactocin-coupled SDR family oxidoreductase [Acidobacteria bacterium]|nr:mycofactocin-coupled SDR family oxidoreductase [Acidobacteriota bacterium]
MAGRVEGKVALVTGAARGQGRAHCVRLAEEGADIIAVDACSQIGTTKNVPATPDDLAETVRLVEKTGRQILASETDVRDLPGLRAVVAAGVERFGGRLDVVVANAGIATYALSWELTPEQWQTMIDVNLTGVWNTTTAAIPHMLAAQNGGSIIMTSSVAGYRGYVGLSHYGAAKHGIVGLSRTLAVELGPQNIRVNTIHPNGVNTLIGVNPPGVPFDLEQIMAAHPLAAQVMAAALPTSGQEPEDVAAMVSWLASDEARFITGHEFPISSGNQLM